MLNKRILSLLLAIVLVVGLMPTSVFATETEGTTAPTESVPETTGEAIEPQNEEDPTPCGICNVVDCGVEHKYCEKCEVYDCGKAHVICEVCKVEDCGVEHKQCDLCGEYDCDGNDVFCDTCNAWNCGKLHNITCETCGKVDCEGHDVTIPTIPTLPTEPEGEEETEEGEVDEHQKLYEDILACDELFEADALVDALSEEEYAAFLEYLTDEQEKDLDDHFDSLIKAYEAKTDVVEDPAAEETEEEEDNREIVYPTKDMTKAAPFGDPVQGPAKRLMRMFAAAPAAEEEDNGLILDKDVSGPDANGVYTLTLEAYATGEKTIIKQESNIPTDIILVLDQSGSMDNSFTSTVFKATSGTPEELYGKRNNLYVKLPDNSYSPVTVSLNYVGTEATYSSYANQTNSTYYENRNNLYHECSDDSYSRITVSRTGNRGNRQYTYTCATCGSLGTTSSGSSTIPSYTGDFYRATTEYQYQYTFSYEKEDGTRETASVLGTDSAPSWNFYVSEAGGNTTRIAALKSAVRTFASSVAEKAKGSDGVLNTEDDVDHTISVVGFANYSNYDNYNNTEVFVGGTGYKYGTAASAQYENAPQDMSTEAGVNNVNASINALDSDGATYIDLGIEMANGILNANPVPSGEKRNRVVIIFTDGVPGYSGNYNGAGYEDQGGNAQAVADAAMTQIATTKNTYGASVYTVGIFTGADATSAGSNANNASSTQRANYFMQRLSSNTSYPQTPSYYLSASDSSALTSIFKTISENIENGGSSIELDETTVVKDIIADSFTLPAGADASSIKVYTDAYKTDGTGFADEPQAFTNAKITIDENGNVSVTNFDFAENWVGSDTNADGETTYRGEKLILEIPIVAKPDFLGGNNVPTNGSESGVYRGDEMVEAFPEPDADVTIPLLDIGVVTVDQKIYLSQKADIAKLVTGLDNRINGSNNAYVDIQYTIMDGTTPIAVLEIPAGNSKPEKITWVVGEGVDMNPALTDDSKTYTIIATASPTSQGTAKQSKNEKPATVTVYKPFVTFQDTSVNAGDSANFDGPSEENRNLVKVEWKNAAGEQANVDTMGPAPELTFGYDKAEGPLSVETEVKVTSVMANNMEIISGVTFYRDTCTAANGCDHVNDGKPVEEGAVNFIVHIKTFDLTITKKGVDVNKDGAAPFVFNVKGGDIDMDVVIYGNNSVTIKGLPAGTYTVTEVNGYWRYDIASDDTASKTVTPSGATASVVFKNARNEDKWLDDWAKATNNFG